jgi:hypothetical protein
MAEELSEYRIYDVRCKDLMEEDGVRFVGILNDKGKLLAGGFKPGITPLEKDEEKFKRFMERVIEISLRREYEDSLGKLNYVACRRDKVVLVSFPFPVSRHILLVSAQTSIHIEKLSEKVCRIFGGAKLFSEWDMKSST